MLYIIISILFFIIFLIHSYFVIKNKWNHFDNKFYEMLKFTNMKTTFLKVFTNLASTPYFVILSIFLILLVSQKKQILAIILGLVIDAIIIFVVKHIVKRDRPNIKRLVKEKGYSYISGHTFSAVFFYGLMCYLIFFTNLSLLTLVLLFVIFIIAYSRIYLGVHYLSDVIGGLLLGISYLTIYIYLTSFLFKLF